MATKKVIPKKSARSLLTKLHPSKPGDTEGHRAFRLSRKSEMAPADKVISPLVLLSETWRLLGRNWKLFGGLGALYVVAYRLLVIGSTSIDFNGIKDVLNGSELRDNNLAQTGVLLGSALNGSFTTNGEQASLYANLLTIVFGLCVLWATRYAVAGKFIKIRDALYNGTGPLISTLVVLMVVFFQALPLTVAAFIYYSSKVNGIVQGGVEDMALFIFCALLGLLSLYWLSASILAMVAVTLPGMYPRAALRATKEMVAFRRWQVLTRLLVMALFLGLIWIVVVGIFVSNRFTMAVLAEVLDILRGLTLLFVVVYVYKLYRSLIHDTETK